MEPTLLAVDGLAAGYGKIQVIWDVSLRVQRGETAALVGPNGAGKSTLLRAIAGLLVPHAGRIVFGGREIGGRPAYQVARLGLALVPEGRELFPALSVHETLLLGGRLAGSRPGVQERLERVYAAFPVLKDRRGQRAATLSGGEQQMLAIGRALMARPTLLMLDEPSTGLAPVVVDRIIEVIRTLPAQGTSTLLVEQNVPLALEVADRAYVLERGRVILDGPGPRLRDHPLIREAYVGPAAGS
jgi:branched-chain amino acid transport system ATP-binding protein